MPPRSEFNLTYLVNTRNKLPFLRQAMLRLLAQVGADEEVVVVDGASSDGTAEYLGELHRAGKVHQLLSEPDRGEAHGWNKGLLLARGELIKLISDDDVFHYPPIRACKEFMLANPRFDFLSADVAMTRSDDLGTIVPQTYYRTLCGQWAEGKRDTFPMYGLGFLLRRDRLPLTGLFHTGCKFVDHEFGLRVSKVADLCWCAATVAVGIVNPGSGMTRYAELQREEEDRTKRFYGFSLELELPPGRWSQLVQTTKRRLWKLVLEPRAAVRAALRRVRRRDTAAVPASVSRSAPCGPAEAFATCSAWLESCNAGREPTFIYRQGTAVCRPAALQV